MVRLSLRPWLAACLLVSAAPAAEVSLSAETAKALEAPAADAEVTQLVSVPCRQRLKERSIMVLMAEQTRSGWLTEQQRYGPHFQAINSRLRALGLRTFTPEQIRSRIAQAEINAYFNNDTDAALSASKRLGAQYVLRGRISTQTSVNPILNLDEVSVRLDVDLESADGRLISSVNAHADAYSGADTLSTALDLVNEQADRLVARLYNDYCRGAERGRRNQSTESP
jgi:hypothetical protein